MDRSDFPDNDPPRPVEIDEEEEKKRARGSGAGSASLTHAQLGANIRPDVVSAPGGLHTITTQKSADYRPDLADARDAAADQALDRWLAEQTGRAQSAPDHDLESEQTKLRATMQQLRSTLHDDPSRSDDEREAHKGASKAHDASVFELAGNVDTGVPVEQKQLESLAVYYRYAAYLAGELTARYDRNDEPAEARQYALRGRQFSDEAEALGEMIDSPVALHELAQRLAENDTSRFPQADRDANEQISARQANEESTKRQDNERRAAAGEDIDPAADITDYISGLVKEAREEATIEHGAERDQAPGIEPGKGGPGRGDGGGRGF